MFEVVAPAISRGAVVLKGAQRAAGSAAQQALQECGVAVHR